MICKACKVDKDQSGFGRTKKRQLFKSKCLQCEGPKRSQRSQIQKTSANSSSPKECETCTDTKLASEFNQTKHGFLRRSCRECERIRANETHKRWRNKNKQRKKEFDQRWRDNNPDKFLAKTKRYNKKSRIRKAQAVFDYLFDHPCVDCGESDVKVLDFDHVRGTKKMAVRSLLSRGSNLSIIFEEIAKCEVRCSNCHRKATIERAGLLQWLKYPT